MSVAAAPTAEETTAPTDPVSTTSTRRAAPEAASLAASTVPDNAPARCTDTTAEAPAAAASA